MGLGTSDLQLLISLRQQGYLSKVGKIIEVGAQQLNNSFLTAALELQMLGKLYDRTESYTPPAPLPTVMLDGGYEHQPDNAPYARPFWEWLGYRYTAIDIDESPDVISLDLNYDEVPPKAKKQYDLVTNYGTTEHVANQLQAFKIIHDLTAVSGVMIHSMPAQGNFNHGLINYNPKFIWLLARSNHYRVLFANFTPNPQHYALPENIQEYISGFDAGHAEKIKDYKSCDVQMLLAVQKVRDMEFIPPLDVPTGSTTSSAVLRKRYWTVFNPSSPLHVPNIFNNIFKQ